MATWVFGYGSLVSRSSLAATLEREVGASDGWAEADIDGYGRRWNYGAGHVVGRWTDGSGLERSATIVALGVVPSATERVNGIVVAVGEAELERLDVRERHYDRVDVTSVVTCRGASGPAPGDRVVTYVPRPAAIERYERARDEGSAAIETRYWDLVLGAFAALGADRLATFHATTPPPDVPTRPLRRVTMR